MSSKYVSKPKELKSYKQKIYVFDLDGCIANSDDFILTNEEAFKKDPSICDRLGPGFRGKLTKENKKLFSEAYLADHQLEIEPYYGILDLFVRMSQMSNTAIITSRVPLMSACTIEWLEHVITERYGKTVWRQLSYKLFFNELKEKSLAYKKRIIEQLMQTYDIALIVDDHPEIANYAKSKGLVCLVPATGYKDLNGNDLMVAGKKCLRPATGRKRKTENDNLQKK